MSEVELFFARKSQALLDGDFETLGNSFEVPTEIWIGARSLRLTSRDALLDALRTYRDNLKVEGFARTDWSILHQSEAPDGALHILKRCVDRNSRGSTIQSVDMSCVCRKVDGQMKISAMEIVSDVPKRFLFGLPI